MKSVLGLGLGISILAAMGGCGDTAPTGTPAVTVGGSSGSATGGTSSVIPTSGSSGTATSGGTGSGVMLPPGVPLTPMAGWVAGDTNGLKIQGAMFSFGDETSKTGMTENFMEGNACIKGTAAKVDMASTPCTTKMFTAPAVDCYGQYWGAAIGLNLNQPSVAGTDGTMMGGDPAAFDASTLKGFAFEITGAMVPTSLRFKVEDAAGVEYCTTPTAVTGMMPEPVALGGNVFTFTQLFKECWKPGVVNSDEIKGKPGVKKIAWQVVTNDKGTVPFDFCVTNVRALTTDGSIPVSTGGTGSGGTGSSVGGGGASSTVGGGGASSTVGGGGASSTVGGGGASSGGGGGSASGGGGASAGGSGGTAAG